MFLFFCVNAHLQSTFCESVRKSLGRVNDTIMNFATVAWSLGSIILSTSLIIMNKYVMDVFDFKCITFLTSYHFFLTYLVLEIMCRLRLFERASHIPQVERWVMGSFGVGAVVFMNFNLTLNSVGFYQLSKLCCIPFIVTYGWITERRSTPASTLLSLGALLLGMALFTVNDVQFNALGSAIAAVAVSCVSVFQMKTGSKQTEFSVDGPALQHATALPQFILASACAVAMETHGAISIFEHQFEILEISMIVLTGFVAVGVNVCAFGLIGRTSAVTYQVVGHIKTILIFVFGLIMFPAPESETRSQALKKIVGLIVSMIGVIIYTLLEMRHKEVKVKTVLSERMKMELQEQVPFTEMEDVAFE
jgi:solute carrier family 35 protein E3